MGTSASFRAPATPRWQAFTTALQTGQPLERVQSELFNAGAEWERELGAPAVAAYAVALLEAAAPAWRAAENELGDGRVDRVEVWSLRQPVQRTVSAAEARGAMSQVARVVHRLAS